MNIFLLDLETTGLNPYHDSIIELCIKKLNEDIIYETLCKPSITFNGKFISEKITNITKITHNDIKHNGISQFKLCENFYKFLKDNTSKDDNPIYIIAHNGNMFDMVFIRNLFRLGSQYINDNLNIKINKLLKRIKCLDTLLLSKLIIKDINSYSQSSLCSYYKISSVGLHRAKNDVLVLEKIYNNLILNISDNIENIYNSL
jgi:DNA polymerase III alpha subunit (gram-positive type)